MDNKEKKDRRSTEKKDIEKERRQQQRRKEHNVDEGTPIRRQEDWDKIDDELK